MIEGLSLIILGLIIVNALYDCLRYYKKMETDSLRIRCVIGYLGFSFAIAHIFYFIYNNQCIGGLKQHFSTYVFYGYIDTDFHLFHNKCPNFECRL